MSCADIHKNMLGRNISEIRKIPIQPQDEDTSSVDESDTENLSKREMEKRIELKIVK